MVPLFLPYMEPIWKRMPSLIRVPATIAKIKEAGFDGVECLLIGRLLNPKRIQKVRDKAFKEELEIRFHQGWSWETGQRILPNYFLRALGALVPAGTSLIHQMHGIGFVPVVIYGNHVNEAARQNYLYQTVSRAWAICSRDSLM